MTGSPTTKTTTQLSSCSGICSPPTDPDAEPICYPNWTRLVCAGNGLFSSEEDIYNSNPAIASWLQASGQLATEEIQRLNA